MKLFKRPAGNPNFAARRSDSWQPEQVLVTAPRKTIDAGSVADRIVCSPWQSVHTGDSLMPWALALP